MSLLDILRPLLAVLRRLGPYALLELLMPGGTILALLWYLYRRRMDASGPAGQASSEFPGACASS